MKQTIFTTLCLLLLSINIYAKNDDNPMHLIAAGESNYETTVVQSLNGGANWNRTEISARGYHHYTGGTCKNKFCVLFGPDHTPLLQSRDHGSNWEFATFAELPFELNHSTCEDAYCIVVGMSIQDGRGFTFIALTKDQGKTWERNNFVEPGRIRASACTGTFCIVAGGLLAQSNDSGEQWKKVIAFDNTSSKNYFGSVSCSTDICVVAGTENIPNRPTIPLLVQTKDHGITWTKIKTPLQAGNFNSVSCADKLCVAAGMIAGAPYLLQTTDGGASWHTPTADLFLDGHFNAVSCGEQLCVAAGENKTTYSLLLMQTTDGGTTWSAVTNPEFFKRYTGFESVTCSNKTCIAAAPVNGVGLWQTLDGGMQWRQVQIDNDYRSNEKLTGTAIGA